MTATIHETDSFSLNVAVIRQPGNTAYNLTGAALEAYAESGEGEIIAGVCETQSAATGALRVSFPPDTFKEGAYILQVRVEKDGEVQTVLTDYVISVLRSIGD